MKRFVEYEICMLKGFGGEEYPVKSAVGEPKTLSDLISQVPDMRSRIMNTLKSEYFQRNKVYKRHEIADSILQLFKEV